MLDLLGAINDFAKDLLGTETPSNAPAWWQIGCRAALVYVGGLALMRLGKSRFMARASAMDMMVAILLGSILARGVTAATSLSAALAASAVLIALHWLGTWLTIRSHRMGDLMLAIAWPCPRAQVGRLAWFNASIT